jgi:hypothetical protein
MTDLSKLEALVLAAIDEQAQTYAGNLFKTFMTPNATKADERFIQGLRKLAKDYNRVLDMIDAEFNVDQPLAPEA